MDNEVDVMETGLVTADDSDGGLFGYSHWRTVGVTPPASWVDSKRNRERTPHEQATHIQYRNRLHESYFECVA